MNICKADGCSMIANRVGANLCEKHYTRQRRNGTLEKQNKVTDGDLTHTGGYLLSHLPGHPLQKQGKRVYAHRAAYYDAYGDGPFDCHWCGKQIGWDFLHIDHLNDIKTDNRICNLVPSCPVCNQSRGQHKMTKTQRSRKEWQYTAHGKTMCLSEWSRYLGISRASILYRLRVGWHNDDVFSPRKGNTGPKSKRPINAK